MNWKYIVELFTDPMFTVGHTPVSLWTLLQFVLIVVLAFVAARFLRRLVRTRLLVHTKMDAGLQYLVSRIFGYIVLVLGLMIGLESIGVNLSSLTVIAGALGVGIGFGLQNIVHNFVSGLILMGERSIQIGDRVDVGGTLGEVTRIGARSTSVRTNDNIIIIVPNSEFVTNRVINWTQLGDQRVRLHLPVGVSYASDPRTVERLLLETAAAHPHVLKDPEPRVVFRGFGDSALNFELRVWTTEMTRRPTVLESDLYFAIWDAFKAAGIEIPFPQRDLHLKEPVKVELTEQKMTTDVTVGCKSCAGDWGLADSLRHGKRS
jgi:small-conductance mechanosensitive channel